MSKRLRPPPSLDDSSEEEVESSDDEEARKPSAKKKSRMSSFLDDEAEGSDEDEDEDLEGEGMDEQALEIIRQQDRRRAQSRTLDGLSAAEVSRDIERRHRAQHRRVDRSVIDRALPSSSSAAHLNQPAEASVPYTSAVAQQSLVPSVSDPSLWMVNCTTGKEQQFVFQIMNKSIAQARTGRPLGISGVIAAQSKGKIYIESFSEPAVMEAINGVRGVMAYSMKLVPIADMTTVMTVVTTKKPVKVKSWVRMTRGHYKGDLALVKAVKDSGLKAIVQCVPRLDLAAYDLPPAEAQRRRRTHKPPKKFFNAQDISNRQTLRRQRFPGLDLYCDYYEGNYYHDGYLLKEMTVGSMIKACGEDDPPTLDELQSFQHRKKDDADAVEENEGSKMASTMLEELAKLQGNTVSKSSSSSSSGLAIGDTVEVIEGDLIGLRGKLIGMDQTTVKVKPSNNTEIGDVDFLSHQVRKYIPVGSHVKVTDGHYANETGVVVAIDVVEGEPDCTAVVLTDVTNKEISVRTSQLRESADIASGGDELMGYRLYDLVSLAGGGSATEVAVIVRVGREEFTVINNHGIAREVRPEELRGKQNSRSSRAVALDVQGNQIRSGDTVNVAEGPHKGKTATIKRVNRTQLFLHSQTRTEHAGIFVVRSKSCVLAGSRNQNRARPGGNTASPFGTPMSQASNGPPRGKARRKDDGLTGKTVRIRSGQWKGYIGTVADSTATHVQVELHSRLKKVMVVRDRVVVVGDKFGATENPSDAVHGAVTAQPTTMTMQTPMHTIGGATPAIHGFGGATPAHDGADNDDVWRPGGAIDQEAEVNDGWGGSSTTNNDAESTTANNDDASGWGGTSTTESAWGGSSTKQEESVKREAATEITDNEETPVWFMERVCVKVKDGDKDAVIKEIQPDKSAVIAIDGATQTVLRVSELSMVAPAEHDRVLVTGGNEIGLEGSLVCVDGSDAIVKDANDEFKIIDFVHLVKISAD